MMPFSLWYGVGLRENVRLVAVRHECQNRLNRFISVNSTARTVMAPKQTHVSLIAIPDAVISTLAGIYDVLSSFAAVAEIDDAVPLQSPFNVEIIGETGSPVDLASGLPVAPHKSIDDIAATDIVIVPSVLVAGERWETGRYPALVDWLRTVHAKGATLCSACSGIFLLGETGIFDAVETTVHWGYASVFARTYPSIPVAPEKALIVSGERQRLVSSGASTSWHDLVLYLITRRAGPVTAQAIARFYALQWHQEGLAPYIVFIPERNHGDGMVLDAQDWLASHYAVAAPVDEMIVRSGYAERTFQRRFVKATGYTPIVYVQQLRIGEAKRRLERTDEPIDEIGWKVGYEDPAFFHRLFKRTVQMTPGAYRRMFKLPDPGA
jgi:transcriptional regulator GlxA family with amidase domain